MTRLLVAVTIAVLAVLTPTVGLATSPFLSPMVCDLTGNGVFGASQGHVTINESGHLHVNVSGLPAGKAANCILVCNFNPFEHLVEGCGTTNGAGKLVVSLADFLPTGITCVWPAVEVQLFDSEGAQVASCDNGIRRD